MESEKDGNTIFAVGYKYSSQKVLVFLASEGCGSTLPGAPYEARWIDCHEMFTHILSLVLSLSLLFFEHNNRVDVHNQACQADLALEKMWITFDPYFCLNTTLFGMSAIDCMEAYAHHLHKRNPEKDISIQAFANLLAQELFHNT